MMWRLPVRGTRAGTTGRSCVPLLLLRAQVGLRLFASSDETKFVLFTMQQCVCAVRIAGGINLLPAQQHPTHLQTLILAAVSNPAAVTGLPTSTGARRCQDAGATWSAHRDHCRRIHETHQAHGMLQAG